MFKCAIEKEREYLFAIADDFWKLENGEDESQKEGSRGCRETCWGR